MTTSDRFARLPKWAQQELARLRMRLREAQSTIDSLEGVGQVEDKTNVTYRYGLEPHKPLRRGTKARFHVGPTKYDIIEVGFDPTGRLLVWALHGHIAVLPEASNVIGLRREDHV